MCDASLNLYDFEARLYSPVTGRFVQVDPMAEKYYPISPFAYCGNNPITYSDPDGQCWNLIIGALIGATADYAGQVIGNLLAGEDFKGAVFSNIDWVDVGISAIEGAITGGTSTISSGQIKILTNLISGTVSSALQAGFDYTTEDGFETGSSGEIIGGSLMGLMESSLPGVEIRGDFLNKIFKGKTVSNTKLLNNEMIKASSNGDVLSSEAKNALRSHNNQRNQDARINRKAAKTSLGDSPKEITSTSLETIYDRKTEE